MKQVGKSNKSMLWLIEKLLDEKTVIVSTLRDSGDIISDYKKFGVDVECKPCYRSTNQGKVLVGYTLVLKNL